MKINMFRKILVLAGLVVLICGFAMPAGALMFNFTQNTGFVVNTTDTADWTYSYGDLLAVAQSDYTNPIVINANREDDIKWFNWGGAPVAALDGHYNTIVWGVNNNAGGLMANDSAWGTDPATVPASNNYSGLQVLGQTGIFGLNEWVTITEVYHQNHAIPASIFTLSNATINSVLEIGINAIDALPDDFDSIAVLFLETLNQAGQCPADAPDPALGSPCPDYWEFSLAGFAPLSFEYGDETYLVYFDLVPGADAVIHYLENDMVRVWTAENVTSNVSVRMMIARVPEPGILALLGLGLLGLGIASRRREDD